MLQDEATFAHIFGDNIQIADRTLPRCNVLFVYGAMDAFGRIAGMSWTFRDFARRRAHIFRWSLRDFRPRCWPIRDL